MSILSDGFIDELFKHPKFNQNFIKMLNDQESHINKSNDTSSSQHINQYYIQNIQTSIGQDLQQFATQPMNQKYACYNEKNRCKQIEQTLHELTNQITQLLTQKFEGIIINKVSKCISEQVTGIKNKIQRQSNIQQFINNLQAETCHKPQYITYQQYKNCEMQLFQKIDVCIHRNYSKIQSIFSDKLNTSQIAIYDQLQKIKILVNKNDEKVNSKNQTEGNDLYKKLRSSKSIGNLLGLKL